MSAVPHPKAILLDLDDTIIDDSVGVDDGWRVACEDADAAVFGIEPAVLQASIMSVRDWYWSDPSRHRAGRADLRAAGTWIVGEALRRLEVDRPELAPRIANRYRDVREEALSLFPGALDALARMKSLGLGLALLTNGAASAQRAKIERFGLAPFFEYVCIEGEFGCGKPDRRVYVSALSALACDASDAWMAGDNLEWDVAAPMRLGIHGVWIDRSRSGPPAGSPKPDRIIESIVELI